MIGEAREQNTSQVHTVSRCHEETWKKSWPMNWPKKAEENQKSTSLFRYRELPEEIQRKR
jgi:hypothetical protein